MQRYGTQGGFTLKGIAGSGSNPLGTEKISGLIIRFSVPAIISMLVNAIYNIIDQIYIGYNVGYLGIAATNVAFPITTVCTAIALLLGIGGASNFNLKLGAGKKEEAGYIAGNTLTLLLVAGTALAAVVLLFLDPLVHLLGATQTVFSMARQYTAITAPGIPFLIFATGACNLIRADGSPNYAMGCMLAGAIFNVIFDPIFMIVLGMGMAGIALATTLGQVLSFCIAIAYLLRRFSSAPLTRRQLRPRFVFGRAICALGAAAFFNQLAMMVVQVTMNNTLRYYGGLSQYGSDIPLAAVGAVSKLSILFLSFPIGIGQGCQPIVGFNYGAKKYPRVKQTYRLAVTIASCFSIGSFLLFQLFPRQLLSVFGTGDELYMAFAVRYLRIFLLMAFVNGIQPVTANFFTSIGKAKMGVLISLTRQILFLLPLILVLPLFWGIDGVIFAGPIADSAAAALSIFLILREMRIITGLEQQMEAGMA